MHAEGVQSLVIAEFPFEDNHRKVRDDTGGDTTEHRSIGVDEPGCRGDDHQAGDNTRAEPEYRRLFFGEELEQRPDKPAGGRGQGGGQEGVAGQAVGRAGRSGVEPVPAHPEDGGADHAQHQAVRRHGFPAVAEARAENERQHQGRIPGGHVHHQAAGKVDGAQGLADEAAAPDHVGEREVDEQQPAGDKGHERGVLHALGNGADDERRGDDGKGQLEHGEHRVGHAGQLARKGDVAAFRPVQPLEEDRAEITDELALAGKAQAVAKGPPHDGGQAGDAETLGEHGEHVFAAHEPAVKQGQAGQGHEQHQGGAGHHPGGVATVDGRGLVGQGRSGRGGKQNEGGEHGQVALFHGVFLPVTARRCRSRRCGCA